MGATIKASPLSGTLPRPKKSAKSHIITLKLSPKSLAIFRPIEVIKVEPEPKAPSSSTSNTLAGVSITSSPGENASESTPNTPVPSGTEGSTAMPPPAEVVKKTGKGIKRNSTLADGLLKPRGKPGPKKKLKLEDGSIDPNAKAAGPFAAPHKLGPKANQGAINAGLRALDRSGKPCRKWQKGSFKVKSFTGAVWEIPRWQSGPKVILNGEPESSTSGSNKENKDSTSHDSDKSNTTDVDADLKSSASINPSSPAPNAVAAEAA